MHTTLDRTVKTENVVYYVYVLFINLACLEAAEEKVLLFFTGVVNELIVKFTLKKHGHGAVS